MCASLLDCQDTLHKKSVAVDCPLGFVSHCLEHRGCYVFDAKWVYVFALAQIYCSSESTETGQANTHPEVAPCLGHSPGTGTDLLSTERSIREPQAFFWFQASTGAPHLAPGTQEPCAWHLAPYAPATGTWPPTPGSWDPGHPADLSPGTFT